MQFKKNYDDKTKREKTKMIIFNRPKIRYIDDLTDLSNEIKKNTKYLYLFIIIDHFSKFLKVNLLENQKQKIITNCLIDFIKFYGKPREFCCDNGREFINTSVKNFLLENDIKMINGRPYIPRS